MYKKLVSIIIGVVLLLSVAVAEPTERVSVFEFYELQAHRIENIKDKYGIDLGTIVVEPIVMDEGDYYSVNGSFGYIMLDKSDLTIESLLTTLIDVEADKTEGHNVVLRALIAMSSLEMDEFEAEGIEGLHMLDESLPADVLMKYIDEYDKMIHPLLDAVKLESGEKILVYQDNYDYYASYRNYSGKGGKIYLAARVHE